MKRCVSALLAVAAATLAASALRAPEDSGYAAAPLYGDSHWGSDGGYYFFDSTEPSDPIFRYWWFYHAGSTGWADNDAYWTTYVHFDVRFFGVDYPAGSTLYVGSNGLVGFVEEGMDEPINQRLPDPEPPNGLIAGWWDDLDGSQGGNIHLDRKEKDGVRALAITYQPQYFADGAPADPIKFQIQIYEQEHPGTNNRIEVHYYDVYGDSWRDEGNSATVGLESPDGSQAALYSYDEPVLTDLLGVRFIDQRVHDSQLGPFDLLAPPDGSEITIGQRVVFRWERPTYAGDGELNFRLIFADNPELTNPVAELNAGSSNFKEVIFGSFGLDPRTWYWSVKCTESTLGITRWAKSVWSFNLVEVQDDTPPWVTGQHPADGASDVPVSSDIIFHAADDLSGVETSSIVFTCESAGPGGRATKPGGTNGLIPGQLDIDDSDPLDVVCVFNPDEPLPPDEPGGRGRADGRPWVSRPATGAPA